MTIRRKVAAGLGGLALMLGTVGGVVAVNAATTLTAPPAITQLAPPVATQAEPKGVETADTPVDPSAVKVTMDQAKAAALTKFPGGTVGKAELQNENGAVIWGVSVTDASGAMHDVKVDATTGQVSSVESDTPDTGADGETAD